MVIRYRTNTPVETRVVAGTDLSSLSEIYLDPAGVTEHSASFTGLLPGTKYYYAVMNNSNYLLPPDSVRFFRTNPLVGTGQPLRAWILGDCGTGNNNARAVRDAYYNFTAGEATDLLLMLGDNAYNDGTDAEYQTAVFQNMYEGLLQQTPVLPTPGNHEFDNGFTDSGTESGPYYDIFTLPRNAEMGGIASGTEAYYSYDFGQVHFISLDSHDSDRSPGGSMLTWLSNDLAATDQEWIVVYFHHPPYSKGSHDSDWIFDSGGRMFDMRQNVLPILESYGVDLVLSGHSHSYERSFLLHGHYGTSGTLTPAMIIDGGDGKDASGGAYQKTYTSGSNSDGAVYITAGSSGKTSGGPLNHPVMYASFNLLGSCVMDIDSNRLELKFITNTGAIMDSFAIEKAFVYGAQPIVSLSQPLDGAYLPGPQVLNLQVNASDPDGNVVSVEYFVNGLSVGSSNTAPFDLNWNISANGTYDIYAVATDDSANMSTSPTHTLSVGLTVGSQVLAISTSTNDAEEGRNGQIKLFSSDLEMINEGSGGGGDQLVALRFKPVNIPPNAVIDSAFVQFQVDETSTINPVELLIYGEDHFDSPPFTTNVGDLSDRRRTGARVFWSPPNWNSVGQAGPDQETPDLQSVLQEIVDLPGWASGNALTLMVGGWGRRVAESFDGSAAPVLRLYYSSYAPVINTPPQVEIWSPRDSLVVGSLLPIRFAAQTQDTTGYVERVRFYVNGNLEQDDAVYPFAFDYTPSVSGIYSLVAEAEDEGGLIARDTVILLVDNSLPQNSLSFAITAPNDDAEEYSNGTVQLNHTELEICRAGVYSLGRSGSGVAFSGSASPSGHYDPLGLVAVYRFGLQ